METDGVHGLNGCIWIIKWNVVDSVDNVFIETLLKHVSVKLRIVMVKDSCFSVEVGGIFISSI